MNEVEIVNAGHKDIEESVNLKLDIKPKAIDDDQKFIFFTSSVNKADEKTVVIQNIDKKSRFVTVERPYFKRHKVYKEEEVTRLLIFSNDKIDIDVTGSGKNWGVKMRDVNKTEKKQLTLFFVIGMVTPLLTILVIPDLRESVGRQSLELFALLVGASLVLVAQLVDRIKKKSVL